jgi:hypothetical protein
VLSGTVALNPGLILKPNCADVTASVSGIQVGDQVMLSAPTNLTASGTIFTFVPLRQPTAGTLTVRVCNVGAADGDPPSGTWGYVITR